MSSNMFLAIIVGSGLGVPIGLSAADGKIGQVMVWVAVLLVALTVITYLPLGDA